jgi:cytochrome c oxidase subunit IV
MVTHTPEQLKQEERRYLQVFAWLAVLTAVEIAVIYMPIPRLAIGVMLVVLAATKAALCVLLIFALLPDLGGITRALTHAAPPAAEAPH